MKGSMAVFVVVLYGQSFGTSSFAPPKSIDARLQGDLREVEEMDRDLARGQSLAQEGKYSQALNLLERSKARDPDNPIVWYWIGYCHENLGQKEAALSAYNQALHKNPKLVQAWWGKGSVLFTEKQYEEAYKAFEELMRQMPQHPLGYFYAGASLWMQKRQVEAIPLWEKAISLGFADSLKVLVWIGDAYWEADSFALAEKAYARAARSANPPAEALLGLGKARLAQNDPEGALPLLTQAETRLPEDPLPPYYKGLAYKRLGKLSEAQAAFQEALRRKPDHARSLYEMGLLSLAQNNIDEAQKYYEKLKTLSTRLAQQLLQEILNKR
ncbi:MAG: tetratricopeptide repeat protein [Bacteroidia bacterium]|nr:tetratricopeptide repeat protein [Bacteroidia bacterium]MDW8057948.1 tetratricopeptide repeat protein [Bacteroidia bacterium]